MSGMVHDSMEASCRPIEGSKLHALALSIYFHTKHSFSNDEQSFSSTTILQLFVYGRQ